MRKTAPTSRLPPLKAPPAAPADSYRAQKSSRARGCDLACQDRDAHISNCYCISVADGLMIELQTSVGACNDPGASQRCKLATATHEIVVKVRFEKHA